MCHPVWCARACVWRRSPMSLAEAQDNELSSDSWEPQEFSQHLSDLTPRTLRACEVEGIRPQDLTYIPFSWFELPGVSKKLALTRHLYFEARRADLLEVVERARDAIIAGRSNALSVMAIRDPDDMQAQYRNTVEFFRRQYASINMTNIVPTKDMASQKKTMPDVDLPNIPLDAAANNPKKPASPLARRPGAPPTMNRSRSIGCSAKSPPGPGTHGGEASPSAGCGSTSAVRRLSRTSSAGEPMGRRMSLSTTPKSIQSEVRLQAMFKALAESPGAGMKELEGIKRTKNNLFALREIDLRKLGEVHERNARLAKKRNATSLYQFQRLMQDLDEQHDNREYRETMAPPQFYDSKRHWREKSRANRLDSLAVREQLTQNKLEERIAKEQALEKWLEEERTSRKMKFAELTLADRIRWRGQFEQELQRRDKFRLEVVTTFLQNEARAELKAQRVKDNGALKQELEKLRATHRQLTEFQRIRKENVYEEERQELLQEAGKRRLRNSMGSAQAFQENMRSAMSWPPAVD